AGFLRRSFGGMAGIVGGFLHVIASALAERECRTSEQRRRQCKFRFHSSSNFFPSPNQYAGWSKKRQVARKDHPASSSVSPSSAVSVSSSTSHFRRIVKIVFDPNPARII